ncbi:MAG: DUF790 family protein [Minicystis sp.]
MLTGDLVRARRNKEGLLVPAYLKGPAMERLRPAVEQMIQTFGAMIGEERDTLDETLDALTVGARDRVAALGLRKVLEDRAELETAEGVDPEALRSALFAAATEAHRGLDIQGVFDRVPVLNSVAATLGISVEALERGLYADLRGSDILRQFKALSADEAFVRYNLGLAQAMLLRATKVTVTITGEEPSRYRRIFRAARFHQLLHTVRGNPKAGYTLELDGPFSLFDAVQRYGLRLALFLPSILACRAFDLRADLLWGKEREPAVFALSNEDDLVSPFLDRVEQNPELDELCAGFKRLESRWSVRKNTRIFALPGEVVCVPDLVFENSETGEEVYLEAFGFWSRKAVFQRVELLRKGFPSRILLAVGKQLRVSEELLGEDDAGEVYVYKRSPSPRAVLERLDRKG